jgi:hypothetical protein
MIDKPRFILELRLTNTADRIQVDDPTIIDDKLVEQTFNMLGLFIEEVLKELGLEANETRERELIVELAYRLILREMTTLRQLPVSSNITAKPRSRRSRRQKRDTDER